MFCRPITLISLTNSFIVNKTRMFFSLEVKSKDHRILKGILIYKVHFFYLNFTLHITNLITLAYSERLSCCYELQSRAT